MTDLLRVEDVTRSYRRGGRTIEALRGVSLTIRPGETLGLVGASGCGKSTLARLVMALEQPDEGRVLLDGRDLAALRPTALRRQRGRWSMVFQDPLAAFNPRATVSRAVGDPLLVHGTGTARERHADIARLLERVGLDPALAARPVHTLSGGQCQRVALARALSTGPALVVLDEAISALDTGVRAHILQLLVNLQREDGVAFLFISHDIAAVRAIAHRTAVMEAGRIVEESQTSSLIEAPSSETARRLIAAVPTLDPTVELGVGGSAG